MSIGDALAQARSQAGLTVGQVSQRTCIRETIIRDIERGDFSACGGDFYARGHIRSIARAVGIDPEDLVQEYDATHGAPGAITAADVFEPATPIKLKERRPLNWSVAMIVALAVVVGYGLYRVTAGRSPSHATAGSTASPSPHPTASGSASASPSPSPSATPALYAHTVAIHLTAIHDCWVGFYSSSGQELKQAYVTAGSARSWTFHHPVIMKIGNPGWIRLTVNGRDLGKPGSSGQPVSLSLGPGKSLPSPASSG